MPLSDWSINDGYETEVMSGPKRGGSYGFSNLVRSGDVGPNDPDVVHLTGLQGDVLGLPTQWGAPARTGTTPDHGVITRSEGNAKVSGISHLLFEDQRRVR